MRLPNSLAPWISGLRSSRSRDPIEPKRFDLSWKTGSPAKAGLSTAMVLKGRPGGECLSLFPENGGGPGVRLKHAKRKKRDSVRRIAESVKLTFLREGFCK